MNRLCKLSDLMKGLIISSNPKYFRFLVSPYIYRPIYFENLLYTQFPV